MIAIGLQDHGGGVHVDLALRVAPAAAGGAKLLGCFNGGEGLVPEHDLFAGFLPQLVCEILESLFAARDADDKNFGAELRAERRDFVDDVAFIADDGVRRGDRAGVGRGDSDPTRAEVDAEEGHGRDSISDEE